MSPRERRQAREIGKRILQARLETGGMTQSELGELMGVSERSVSAYENGEVVPYGRLERLAEITGRPIAWFLYGEDALPDQSEFAELREDVRTLRSDVREILRLVGEIHQTVVKRP